MLRDFILIGAGSAVRSLAEYRRLAGALGTPVSRLCAVALPDPAVPAPVHAPGEPDVVVVWGPEHSAPDQALVILTLAKRGQNSAIVCRAGNIAGLRAEFVLLDQAAAVIARASLIVDTTVADPGAALGLAQFGRPLLVHSGSGAVERVDHALVYDLWDHPHATRRTRRNAGAQRHPATAQLCRTAGGTAAPAGYPHRRRASDTLGLARGERPDDRTLRR